MKNILLITLYSTNVGNQLQNYALQSILQQMNCNVRTLYCEFPKQNLFLKLKKKGKKMITRPLCAIGIKRFQNRWNMRINSKREKAFKKFNQKYINAIFFSSYKKVREQNYDMYQYGITGSDQVWHGWSGMEEELNFYYLRFLPKEKRISYAASFGFQTFPIEQRKWHQIGLIEMQGISCREIEMIPMIEEMTGKKPVFVLDPTLLISKEEWRKIEKKPIGQIGGKYILVYLLSGHTLLRENVIQKMAKERGADIIDIFNLDMKNYYCTTPDEFIWLVEHAEYVLTDSFHACIFSILFEKDFLVFPREQSISQDEMFGRIESLLLLFKMQDHIYDDEKRFNKVYTDYTQAKKIRQEQAEKSIAFLEKYLKG